MDRHPRRRGRSAVAGHDLRQRVHRWLRTESVSWERQSVSQSVSQSVCRMQWKRCPERCVCAATDRYAAMPIFGGAFVTPARTSQQSSSSPDDARLVAVADARRPVTVCLRRTSAQPVLYVLDLTPHPRLSLTSISPSHSSLLQYINTKSPSPNMPISGHCLCGQVKIEIASAHDTQIACHCTSP